MSQLAPRLIGMTTRELESLAMSMGEPSFRGCQMAQWLYRKSVRDTAGMTDLPVGFRQRLMQEFGLRNLTETLQQVAGDGTLKLAFRLRDGEVIETVFIPHEDRGTVCVSSQAGCVVGCVFCATGHSGYRRNLTPGEIVEQVLCCQPLARVTHVVFMGMGEPLLNYEAVLRAVRLLNHETGIGMRNLTLSTVGIVPNIRRLAAEKLQLTLAVSLHAPDDELRQRLIPTQHRYSVKEIVHCCRDYAAQTSRRVTFEYVLLAGLNDSASRARQLAQLLRGVLCNVNLIPYNPIDASDDYQPPDATSIRRFQSLLEEAGITVTQRRERGLDIDAACGQLRRRLNSTGARIGLMIARGVR